jgi:hypothetical protein
MAHEVDKKGLLTSKYEVTILLTTATPVRAVAGLHVSNVTIGDPINRGG